MQKNAVVGAAIGAGIGAAVWAGISYGTGYEVGYVAWGIGALVGGLAAKFGGRGATSGMVCAVLALASIFAGKLLATQFAARKQAGEIAESVFTREFYDSSLVDARAFAAVTSPDGYPAFMVEHGFSEASEAKGVTTEELADFEQYSVPNLQSLMGTPPPLQAWAAERKEAVVAGLMAELSLVDAVTGSLGPMDLVFAALGVFTAFKLGNGLGTNGGMGTNGSMGTNGGTGAPPLPRPGAPPSPGQPGGPAEGPPSGAGDAPVRRRSRF